MQTKIKIIDRFLIVLGLATFLIIIFGVVVGIPICICEAFAKRKEKESEMEAEKILHESKVLRLERENQSLRLEVSELRQTRLDYLNLRNKTLINKTFKIRKLKWELNQKQTKLNKWCMSDFKDLDVLTYRLKYGFIQRTPYVERVIRELKEIQRLKQEIAELEKEMGQCKNF